MGKDWLYWIGGTGGGRSERSSVRITAGREAAAAAAAATSGRGCMGAVFHLFDVPPLNHHNNLSDFHSNNSKFLPEEPVAAALHSGLEAPRNSLELNHYSPVLSSRKEENNLNLPVGIQIQIQIKTSRRSSTSRTDEFSTESCSSSNSPGIKTPSVVARLMGLDLLPECNSPGTSSTTSRHQTKSCQQHRSKFRSLLQGRSHRAFSDDDISIGARSLPETPRMSSARRSDFERHRLSLQIKKENINEGPLVPRGRRRFRFNPQDENRSPGHYAKQIIKQVKETVSRRVGLDITNTPWERDLTRRDEDLILLKSAKKNSSKISSTETGPDKLQVPDTITITTNEPTTRSPRVSTLNNNQTKALIRLKEQHRDKDSKKVASTVKHTSAALRILTFQATRNKKEETFVHPKTDKTKSKKTPLSSDVLCISSPTVLQAKKDPSPPLTKLPQKQLSSKQSRTYCRPYNRLTAKENFLPDVPSGRVATVDGGAGAEYGNYIQRILKLAGVVGNSTALTSVKWHTHSHPIDPLIFHRIELFHLGATAAADEGTAVLSHRCNRKLVFQLVDELLTDILKPFFHINSWIPSIRTLNRKIPLVDELCRKIDSFPAMNCLVLEDIDSLIDKDLPNPQLNGNLEEGEAMVREIEDEILQRLVRETVAIVARSHGGGGWADKDRWMSRAEFHVR